LQKFLQKKGPADRDPGRPARPEKTLSGIGKRDKNSKFSATSERLPPFAGRHVFGGINAFKT
jgi:hypothetical protein